MTININRILLAGNLTRDPELRQVGGNNNTVAHFTLANNRRWKGNDGETKEEALFVDCECWGRTAELVGRYLAKGRSCFVEGRLKLDQWEDANGGGKRSRIKVLVEQVQFLGNNSNGSASHPSQTGNQSGSQSGHGDTSDGRGDYRPADNDPAPRPAQRGAYADNAPRGRASGSRVKETAATLEHQLYEIEEPPF